MYCFAVNFLSNFFPDIPAALKIIKKKYGKEIMVQICSALVTIISNLLQHSDDPKYRSIKVSSKFVQQNFEPHHGSYAILRHLGFSKDSEKFFNENPDIELLQSELHKFQKVVECASNFDCYLSYPWIDFFLVC